MDYKYYSFSIDQILPDKYFEKHIEGNAVAKCIYPIELFQNVVNTFHTNQFKNSLYELVNSLNRFETDMDPPEHSISQALIDMIQSASNEELIDVLIIIALWTWKKNQYNDDFDLPDFYSFIFSHLIEEEETWKIGIYITIIGNLIQNSSLQEFIINEKLQVNLFPHLFIQLYGKNITYCSQIICIYISLLFSGNAKLGVFGPILDAIVECNAYSLKQTPFLLFSCADAGIDNAVYIVENMEYSIVSEYLIKFADLDFQIQKVVFEMLICLSQYENDVLNDFIKRNNPISYFEPLAFYYPKNSYFSIFYLKACTYVFPKLTLPEIKMYLEKFGEITSSIFDCGNAECKEEAVNALLVALDRTKDIQEIVSYSTMKSLISLIDPNEEKISVGVLNIVKLIAIESIKKEELIYRKQYCSWLNMLSAFVSSDFREAMDDFVDAHTENVEIELILKELEQLIDQIESIISNQSDPSLNDQFDDMKNENEDNFYIFEEGCY